MSLFYTFIFIAILILLNGLFVAAEFSTVSARKSRVFQLGESGNSSASTLYPIITNGKKLDEYVATCQVGITISSLVLGFVGQSQLSPLLEKFLITQFDSITLSAESLSITLVLVVLSIFQVMFGELIPKNLGMQFPETYSLSLLGFIKFSSVIFKPLIWVFNGSGNFLLNLFKLNGEESHGHIHSPEEISLLIDESASGGLIANKGKSLIKNTISLNNKSIRKIMIPRSEMLTSEIDVTNFNLLKILSASQFSRIPVFTESIDHIKGIVHLRDLLQAINNGEKNKKLSDLIIHNVSYFPENTLIKTIFNDLQVKKVQVAIILDEFGGTIGMVTLEDLLEELFGELQDEFDPTQNIMVNSEEISFSGDTQIVFLNNHLKIKLPTDIFETIGGLIIDEVGKIPNKSHLQKQIEIYGNRFSILELSGPKITKILFHQPSGEQK